MIRTASTFLLAVGLLVAQPTVAPVSGPAPATPHESCSFNFDNGAEPQSLDPALMQGFPEFRLCLALFEGLVVPNPQTSKAEPGLAESWTSSDDKKTFTFRLREAQWSDGVPITAQDAVDSWLRVLDPETKSAYDYLVADAIEGAWAYNRRKGPREEVAIRAIDARTFEVKFVQPMPHAVEMLTQPCFSVVPMHVIRKLGKDWARPSNLVSNGPFLLTEWTPRQRIVVQKNPRYWDASSVQLDRIVFHPIEDADKAYELYNRGELDWCPALGLRTMQEVQSRQDFHSSVGSTIYYYLFNVSRKPFQDVRVRKALSMALDRKELCETVLGSGDLPTGGFVPPLGFFRTASGSTYDPEQARNLLAEAGFPGGKGFPRFKVMYNTSARHKRVAEWVRDQWKSILGVEVKLENVEWARFLDLRSKSHDFDVSRAGWQADFADPVNYLDLFRSGGGNNDGRYANPEFDLLLERAAQLPLGEDRDRLLMEAEEVLITRDQAAIPFFFYANRDLIDLQKWGGWYANPMSIHPWKAIRKN